MYNNTCNKLTSIVNVLIDTRFLQSTQGFFNHSRSSCSIDATRNREFVLA